jgi:hypothetical protein
VFFNEGWVDYDDRQNYLLDADLGVSTHFLHVETTFSFRTRILDYLWAGMPIVATGGDSFGRLIAAEGLGITVDEQDVPALAAAIDKVLYDADFNAECRRNVARVRAQFTWEQTLHPLVEFCRNARRAADATDGTALATARKVAPVSGGIVARNFTYARARYRDGGLRPLMRHGLAKARRLLFRR